MLFVYIVILGSTTKSLINIIKKGITDSGIGLISTVIMNYLEEYLLKKIIYK